MITLELPTKILVYTRKRDNKEIWFRLNLNNYRNAHHSVLHKSKVEFNKIVSSLLAEKGIFGHLDQYVLEYQLIVANNRLIDANNIYTIVDKYFQDAMVENKIFEDDNYTNCIQTILMPVKKDTSLKDHIVRVTIKEYEEA